MDILKKLTTLENEATRFGFKWENAEQILAQINSECSEIKVHLNKTDSENKIKLQEEIGDLLHAVFSLCVFCQFDPQETLENSVNKFERRFDEVKQLAKEEGLKSLNGLPFGELMRLWDSAKIRVG